MSPLSSLLAGVVVPLIGTLANRRVAVVASAALVLMDVRVGLY